jgi:peptidoglycan/xylan/chitin deacetylase (PgdA/CDA1 family)
MRRRRCVLVLNYHGASGGHLERHLAYLRRHYRVLPLEAALEDLFAAPAARHDGEDDERTPLVLTFDDGYRDNYTLAAPLARKYALPFTIFLIPHYVESGRHFWFREAEFLVRCARTREASLDGRDYRLDRAADREALARAIFARARSAGTVAEREAFLASTREALGVPEDAAADAEALIPFGWAQARAMEADGGVSYGSHTINHPILAHLEDDRDVWAEVVESRAILERHLGHPIRALAYPVGKPEDIGAPALLAARAAYDWALTTVPGPNTPETDPHLLRRMYTDSEEPWWVLAAQAAGIWSLFSRVRYPYSPLQRLIGASNDAPHAASPAPSDGHVP